WRDRRSGLSLHVLNSHRMILLVEAQESARKQIRIGTGSRRHVSTGEDRVDEHLDAACRGQSRQGLIRARQRPICTFGSLRHFLTPELAPAEQAEAELQR